MLANIELDCIDIKCQCVPETLEAIFKFFAGRSAVSDNIKMFTSWHKRFPEYFAGSEN